MKVSRNSRNEGYLANESRTKELSKTADRLNVNLTMYSSPRRNNEAYTQAYTIPRFRLGTRNIFARMLMVHEHWLCYTILPLCKWIWCFFFRFPHFPFARAFFSVFFPLFLFIFSAAFVTLV